MDEADALRTALTAIQPDPRSPQFRPAGIDGTVPIGLERQHAVIAKFCLYDAVPKAIQIHYETAKNLYLYAWFVYRFYMVSEHYVCSTLELALRERLKPFFNPKQLKRAPSLGELLLMAQAEGLIDNDRLPRENWALNLAHSRHSQEMILKMERENLQELITDESEVQPSEEERTFDWISHLAIHLPLQRNLHAHGNSHLHSNVLWTFEVVCELINQLFTPIHT